MQTVSDILQLKSDQSGADAIKSIDINDTVLDAIQILSHYDVGALVVLEKGKLAGIFSERDYIRKVALLRKEPSQVRVKDIMSKEVTSVSSDSSLEDCLTLMNKGEFRHLPVIQGKEIIGFVSILDVTKSLLAQKGMTITHLQNYVSETWPF